MLAARRRPGKLPEGFYAAAEKEADRAMHTAVRKESRAEAKDERGTVELAYLQTFPSTTTRFGSTGDSEDGADPKILTPCLTNPVALQPGDELVWLAHIETKRKAEKVVMRSEKKQKKDDDVCGEF